MDRHHASHYAIAAALTLGLAATVYRVDTRPPIVNSTHVSRATANVWAPLSDAESDALAAALKPLDLGKIDVFCPSSKCDDIADDFANALRHAGTRATLERPMIAPPSGLWVAAVDLAQARRIVDAIDEGTSHRLAPQVDPTPSATSYISFGGAK